MGLLIAADGARIAYRDEGRGRPLLLLHGLMASGAFFARQAPLAGAFRLVTVDLAGHGGSALGTATPTIATLAGHVAALAETLDLEDAVAVGWSLGAAVMWRLLTGPAGGRFAGAAVIDMTPRVANDESWSLGLTPEACAARADAIAGDFPAFAAAAGRAIFAQPAAPAMAAEAERAAAAFRRSDPAAIAAIWRALVAEDSRPLLPRIAQPTLVAHGAHSHLYGEDTARYLARALPDARLVRFARSGHAPHIEEADLFNDVMTRFAAGLPRRAPLPA